ncbi:unnamed protein product [Polarella glacialis]|uniref:Uncharacterized protein n=1 Tax=Polarella glacialis TaxID=89957 RepID=A0A813DEV7_POLGL|nr:unnamed protein product [Polarella glacialis]
MKPPDGHELLGMLGGSCCCCGCCCCCHRCCCCCCCCSKAESTKRSKEPPGADQNAAGHTRGQSFDAKPKEGTPGLLLLLLFLFVVVVVLLLLLLIYVTQTTTIRGSKQNFPALCHGSAGVLETSKNPMQTTTTKQK